MRAHRLLIVAVLAACGGRTTTAPRAPQPVVTDAVLAKLTTRQKVAQLVVPWLGGNYMALDDSAFQIATRWVDSLEVGGIIISVGSPYDIAAKLNTLQRRSKLPLLVSADLEWGAAMRVVGATAFPYIMAAGATGDERDAYTIGRVAAREGRAVGIHVNFAPDADVNNNPLNPIINTRSFGEDQHAVARLVRAYVRGLQDNGMLATLKHFPGHGDTDADSHLGLPTIRVDYARLDSSVSRVLAIKRQLGLFSQRTVPLDSIARIVGSKAFQEAADGLAQRSLTLVRDTAGTVARLRSTRSR